MVDSPQAKKPLTARETLGFELLQVSGEMPGGVEGRILIGDDGQERPFAFAGGRVHIWYADALAPGTIARTGGETVGYLGAIAGAVFYGRRWVEMIRTDGDLGFALVNDSIRVEIKVMGGDGTTVDKAFEDVLAVCIFGFTEAGIGRASPTGFQLLVARAICYAGWALEEAGRPFSDYERYSFEALRALTTPRPQVAAVSPDEIKRILGPGPGGLRQ